MEKNRKYTAPILRTCEEITSKGQRPQRPGKSQRTEKQANFCVRSSRLLDPEMGIVKGTFLFVHKQYIENP